ncbi:MAG: cellulose binding domain-containing protein [Kineosporiaceae bacterium]
MRSTSPGPTSSTPRASRRLRPVPLLLASAAALALGVLAGPGALAAPDATGTAPAPSATPAATESATSPSTTSPSTTSPSTTSPSASTTTTQASATTGTSTAPLTPTATRLTPVAKKTTPKRTTKKGTILAIKCKTRTGVNDGKRTVRCRTVEVTPKSGRPTDPTTDPTSTGPTSTEPTGPTSTDPTGTPTTSTTTTSTSTTTTAPAAACEAHWTWVTEWNGGHQSALTVRNLGGTSLEPWTLSLQLAPAVTSMWPYPYTAGGGTVTVTAPTWATALAPGAALDLGWIGSGAAAAPTAVSLNGVACAVTR